MYTVDQLIKYAETLPVITVQLSELEWQYPHDRISKKRLAGIVIDGFPVIVTRRTDGTLVTLDGFHRAYKALKEGRKTIKARMITPADIEKLNKDATVSTEENKGKEKDPKAVGDDIQQIREFGESKDMPEETIDGMIKTKLSEETNSLEEWLSQTVAGTADQSSMEQLVSQEGFLEFAGDIIRNATKGKKPSEFDMNAGNAADTINRTYANPAWVAKRRIVKGEPTILNVGSMLVGDWKAEMKKVVQAAQACWQTNTPILSGIIAKAKPTVDFLDSGAWDDPAKIETFYTTKFKEAPNSVTFKDWTYKAQDPATAKVPTLDAAGVVEAAKTVMLLRDVLKQTPFQKLGWHDLWYRKAVNGRQATKWTGEDPEWNKIQEKYGDTKPFWRLQEMVENLSGCQEHIEYDWHTEGDVGVYEIYCYIRALIRLIDESVK